MKLFSRYRWGLVGALGLHGVIFLAVVLVWGVSRERLDVRVRSINSYLVTGDINMGLAHVQAPLGVGVSRRERGSIQAPPLLTSPRKGGRDVAFKVQPSNTQRKSLPPLRGEVRRGGIEQNKDTNSNNNTQTKTTQLIQLIHQSLTTNVITATQSLHPLKSKSTLTVQFKLDPQGMITQIKITKPSGNTNLDQITHTALLDLAPFKPAQQYLKTTQLFAINLEFHP